MDYNTLVKMIPGYTGWGQAEALADYAATGGVGKEGAGGGSSNVDLNALTNLTAQQRAGTSNFITGLNTESADYLKRYTDFINSQEGMTAAAQRIGGELGIPTLQANATMLRNTLTNLPSTYGKAMTGYDVNANQLARIIGQKSSELSPLVTTTETSLQAAQGNLATRLGYLTTEQAKALLPYQTEKDLMINKWARETTLFSEDNQRELDALIAKINAGVTLSEGDKNRANALAIQEKQYQQALEVARIQLEGTKIQYDYSSGWS